MAVITADKKRVKFDLAINDPTTITFDETFEKYDILLVGGGIVYFRDDGQGQPASATNENSRKLGDGITGYTEQYVEPSIRSLELLANAATTVQIRIIR